MSMFACMCVYMHLFAKLGSLSLKSLVGAGGRLGCAQTLLLALFALIEKEGFLCCNYAGCCAVLVILPSGQICVSMKLVNTQDCIV